jgi:poly(hydroxyalkanoate) granule-associated protein
MNEVSDQVNKAAQSATNKANAAWDKLEQVFEDRVARALNRLGVPTNNDIQTLTKKVAELNLAVTALRNKQSKTAAAPRARAAKKAAVKRA